jgi:hypothetical protein
MFRTASGDRAHAAFDLYHCVATVCVEKRAQTPHTAFAAAPTPLRLNDSPAYEKTQFGTIRTLAGEAGPEVDVGLVPRLNGVAKLCNHSSRYV